MSRLPRVFSLYYKHCDAAVSRLLPATLAVNWKFPSARSTAIYRNLPRRDSDRGRGGSGYVLARAFSCRPSCWLRMRPKLCCWASLRQPARRRRPNQGGTQCSR